MRHIAGILSFFPLTPNGCVPTRTHAFTQAKGAGKGSRDFVSATANSPRRAETVPRDGNWPMIVQSRSERSSTSRRSMFSKSVTSISHVWKAFK